ncbi:MAG: hypothetical protein K8T20_18010 [Planctomycetes bacterium]|nr:hypothetical protein [Planctomycetota bacterium]
MRLASRFKERGFVLLVALGILGVLGLLAAAFATLSRVERVVSASYVDKVRAKLLAESGLERAIAEIRSRDQIQAWDDTRNSWYYREMLNGPVGTFSYSPATIASLNGFTPTRAYGTPPRRLEVAVDDAIQNGTLAGLSLGDPTRPGASGEMPGTYEKGGDFYAIKALDCASMLFVNDQNPQIQRLLNNLGVILKVDAGLGTSFKLGDEIVAVAKARNKPFSHKTEILDLVFIPKLGAVNGRERFKLVRDFITCHAWVDYTTMHFGPKPAGFAATAPATPVDIIDRGGVVTQFVTASGSGTFPAKFGGGNEWVEPRAPVNVNTASREVLVAMLWGLAATFEDYDHASGHLVTRAISISQAEAEIAADHIISARYSFGTPAGAWSFNDWMHFREEVIDSIPGLDRFKRALIHANANPNTDIRKLNPDLLLVDPNPRTESKDLVLLDKSDITVKSTEWTFSSMGLYEIESLGRVVSGGRTLAQESVETVVKIFDALRFTTQEQFEKDRSWTNDDPAKSEGDLYADGYPPVASMPEYAYNNPKTVPSPRYKSATGDLSFAADYDGYLTLNGPAKVLAGVTPTDFNTSAAKMCRKPLAGQPAGCAWDKVDWLKSGKDCEVSGVWGWNLGKIGPNQSHATGAGNPQKHTAPNPTNPEYAYDSPNCDGIKVNNSPANSLSTDDDYVSAFGFSPKRPYQINPAGALNAIGSGFFEDGADVQPFGLYVNYLKRRRFHTVWGDELPTSRFTVEFFYKPEIDHWEWAKGVAQTPAAKALNAGPGSRMHLWGLGAADHGTNYEQWVYVQGSRVFYDMYYAGKHYVIYCDHDWKAHTWHHVEFSVTAEEIKTMPDGSKVTVPPNAMLFVDGKPANGILGAGTDVNAKLGIDALPVKAMVLPVPFIGVTPNNDWGTGPRMEILSKLQFTGDIFGMSQPSTIGTIDNLVIHHWRSHDSAFSPRNRFHSSTYFDGTTWSSGKGYKGETAGVYKKRLVALEKAAAAGDVTLGTVSCTHYHPYHVHLYGHDGAAPTTSFGHITPAIRMKTGGSYLDAYYYDGCAGLPVKTALKAGTECYYLGWFEVASAVPVTMSPILDDITVTYFTEPKVLYRHSSVEAR